MSRSVTSPLLLQAIDRFVLLARERTASSDPGPFKRRSFGNSGEYLAALGVNPHGFRALPAPESPRGTIHALSIDGVLIEHVLAETPSEIEVTSNPKYMSVRYFISGGCTIRFRDSIIAVCEAGDCIFRIAKNLPTRQASTANFSALVVNVPVPSKRRFSIDARDDIERRVRYCLDDDCIAVCQSKLWEVHLAYVLDHALQRAVFGGDPAGTGEVLGEFLYLLGCQELAAQVKSRGKDPLQGIVPLKLKIAENFVAANAARAPSIEEIAAEAKLSVRNLHTLFVRFRGMSPGAFLRERRLTGVHAALLSAETGATVLDIATAWNYRNFGNFAAAYRKRFGELPSQTLDRRIAPPGGQASTGERIHQRD